VICHFSSFPISWPQFSKEKGETAYNFYIQVICKFGVPETLQSDNGGEFVNELVDELSTTYGIHLRNGKPYNPQEQGKIEQFNGTLNTILSKLCGQYNSYRWIDFLNPALFSFKISSKSSKIPTPYEIFFGRKPNLKFSHPQLFEESELEVDETSERFTKEKSPNYD
jgi:transposase InsO family protein